ncbi:MAG: DUF2807 domain-containing protein [Bacteroidales bacterium]|nr:DUF2807 domain-containing protein [Bacteroidales bacterium]
MKKSIIIFGAAVLLGLTCSSCRFITIDQDKLGKDNITISSGVDLGNKDVIKGSDREVSRDFSSLGEIRTLVIDGSADVTVRQSENPVLSIELPANLEDYLRVDYDNGKCNIYLDRSHRYTNASFDIILGTSTLEKLSINGASDIEMGRMTLGDLAIEINGTGDVDIHHITCGDLSIEINGAGEIDAQNMDCKSITAEINGAGEIDLGGKCVDLDARISGTGSVDVTRLECSGRKNVHRDGLVNIKI